MTPRLPVTQYQGRAGVIDLGWGHPRPDALPVEAWAEASHSALRRHGATALAYGHAAGPGPLIEWLCAQLGAVDGWAPSPAEVFVTAGASHALDLVVSLLTAPGDVALVDAPTYHLALRVLAGHGLDIRPVPTDSDGIDPEGTSHLIRRLRDAGRRVPILYVVPTFNNPTGRCLPADRRTALVRTARATGLLIIEDDTYRELSYGPPAPDSLYSIGRDGGRAVVRLGSFSKTVAPGLRLGWLTAPARLVAALSARGYIDSGGGVNHATAMTMAEFVGGGGYERHVAAIRQLYAGQRDALVAAVREHLPQATFTEPGGGWFLWLRLPHTERLLPHAERTGVSYLEGRNFFVTGGGEDHLRLSFSLFDPPALAEGAKRLGEATRTVGDQLPRVAGGRPTPGTA